MTDESKPYNESNNIWYYSLQLTIETRSMHHTDRMITGYETLKNTSVSSWRSGAKEGKTPLQATVEEEYKERDRWWMEPAGRWSCERSLRTIEMSGPKATLIIILSFRPFKVFHTAWYEPVRHQTVPLGKC